MQPERAESDAPRNLRALCLPRRPFEADENSFDADEDSTFDADEAAIFGESEGVSWGRGPDLRRQRGRDLRQRLDQDMVLRRTVEGGRRAKT